MPEMYKANGEGTLPQHFTLFVELFFAVILGAGLIEFHQLLFPPDWTNPSFWAIIAVYFTAITSWIGWHKSTTKYPYTDSLTGRVRSVLDGIIVITYVALLYFASTVYKSFSPDTRIDNSLTWYLWGFFITFLLYFIVGKIRQIEHRDPKASQLAKINYHGVILFIVATSYTVISLSFPNILAKLPIYSTWIFLFCPWAIMISYRYFREWKDLPWTIISNQNRTLAIDLDGVVVEQVIPVLTRVNKERGLDLRKCDIIHWEYPFCDTNIKIEIEKAEQEEEFIKNMPLMEGAKEAIDILSKKYRMIMATSREQNTDTWSNNWLKANGIKYDNLINTRSKGKIITNADILIDDYIGNIRTFIDNGSNRRQAILFAQPWNKDVSTISDLIATGRIKIAHSWKAVLAILR